MNFQNFSGTYTSNLTVDTPQTIKSAGKGSPSPPLSPKLQHNYTLLLLYANPAKAASFYDDRASV